MQLSTVTGQLSTAIHPLHSSVAEPLARVSNFSLKEDESIGIFQVNLVIVTVK